MNGSTRRVLATGELDGRVRWAGLTGERVCNRWEVETVRATQARTRSAQKRTQQPTGGRQRDGGRRARAGCWAWERGERDTRRSGGRKGVEAENEEVGWRLQAPTPVWCAPPEEAGRGRQRLIETASRLDYDGDSADSPRPRVSRGITLFSPFPFPFVLSTLRWLLLAVLLASVWRCVATAASA